MNPRTRPSGPIAPIQGTFHQVLFVIDADEVRDLLTLAPFRTEGGPWVSKDAWQRGSPGYVDSYGRYLREMARRDPPLDPVAWSHALSLRLARSSDIYIAEPTPEPDMVHLEAIEPDVGLGLGGATLDARGRLRMNVVSAQGAGLGLRLDYRKKIAYASEAFAVHHTTEGFPNFSLYSEIEAWVRRNTKPCGFESKDGGMQKTTLRASGAGRAILEGHAWLRARGIRLTK